jgi:hypothetical protein
MNVQWSDDYSTKNNYSCPTDTITIIASLLARATAIGIFTIHDKLMGNTWDGAKPGITPGNT